ncbi:Protein Phosphatase 1 Regulatory Subunit 15B [Manis pentadactyla]|nr:Protein Phosphatase 1 Regulatory Subunit 15B [Manis pentadactyla]
MPNPEGDLELGETSRAALLLQRVDKGQQMQHLLENTYLKDFTSNTDFLRTCICDGLLFSSVQTSKA